MSTQPRILLIDDIRTPDMIIKEYRDDRDDIKFSYEETTIARSYDDGIKQLTENGPWDILLLDHDLGTVKTGNDIFVFLEENTQYLPKQIILVTANTSAAQKMLLGLARMSQKGLIEYFDWRR